MDNFNPKFDPDLLPKLDGKKRNPFSPDPTTEQVVGKPDFEPLVRDPKPKQGEVRPKDIRQDEQKKKQEVVDLIGEKGWKVSRAVFKIAYGEKIIETGWFKFTYGTKSFATGFMISDYLAITNHHVFPSKKEAQNAKALFGYLTVDEDPNDDFFPYVSYSINPDRYYLNNPDLDYAIVGVDGNPGQSWGYIPLPSTAISVPEKVILLQHPNGRPKEIARKNNKVLQNSQYGYQDEKIILYEADTEYGSSGSPVFDLDFNLVALHHWADLKSKEYNKGYLISAIKEDLKKKKVPI
jgi:V8-like Glu-specific endopeptidase